MSGTDLSVIILSYKSKSDLERLLPSIFGSRTKYSFEIIVVDNGSGDGAYEWLESWIASHREHAVKAIKNSNTGFASGNNIGIRQAQGQYILLLNPDTKVSPNTFEVMLDLMQSRPEIGISGCKVVKPDGALDLACRRRFPNPWNALRRFLHISKSEYNMLDTDENTSMAVDSVMGAFLLIRRGVMEKIGLLDEDYFMYGEDLDWCWRCKAAGFEVWYHPETSVTHFKGSSSSKIPFKALKWFHDAMWIFYRKHYSEKYPFFFNWLVFAGIYGRMGVLLILNRFKKHPAVSR